MKLWAGSFHNPTDQKTDDFNSSIAFDQRMVREDIAGSIAHAEMLGAQGILTPADRQAIVEGLRGIQADLDAGRLAIDPTAEDIHTFVEAALTARVGEAGKRLHTARSRNDQVALDIRLTLRRRIGELLPQVAALAEVLCRKADAYADTVMCGYTHLQRAQPITFGHHLMAYACMLLRDIDRLMDCRRRLNVSPLGSGALAGTTYPLDRQAVAAALGMDDVSWNSLDGVSDRDFCLELAADLSILMVHLSRFAEEIILWCSLEFHYIELDDAFSTGSSIMPQKKNPDVAELVRGKSGRVFGDLMTLLTVMKGLPLAYNKDMQEDKEAVFDAVDTAAACLDTFTPMLETMRVCPANMRAAAAGGFINATDAADYLVGKGLPFRDAYRVTGDLVAVCLATGHSLETLPLEDYRAACPLFDEGIYAAVKLETCVQGRTVTGGPAPEEVRRQIAKVQNRLREMQAGF